MPQPNQLPKVQVPNLDPHFQQWLSQLTDTVNTLAGYNGPITLSDHLDMNGNNVRNLGDPSHPDDAISQSIAASKFSPPVISKALEANQPTQLQTYRQINNPNQREQQSGFLNDTMSTPPSSNSAHTVTAGNQVTIANGVMTFSNGQTINYVGRVDVFASVSSVTTYFVYYAAATGVVTIQTVGPGGFAVGDTVMVNLPSDSRFNGAFVVSAVVGTTQFSYQDNLGSTDINPSPSGGTVGTPNVFYYYLKKGSVYLNLSQGFAGDTLQNRHHVCMDGATIVAVVSIGSSGATVTYSGGGASPILSSAAAGGMF